MPVRIEQIFVHPDLQAPMFNNYDYISKILIVETIRNVKNSPGSTKV